MTRAAVVAAVVSALLVGAALGLMGGILFARQALAPGYGIALRRHRGPGPPRVLLVRIGRELGLEPAQMDSIRSEIERSRADFGAVRDSLHARIERHLTPEQRARWRDLVRDERPGEPGGPWPRPHREAPGPEGEGEEHR